MHWPALSVGPIRDDGTRASPDDSDLATELLIVEGDSAATSVAALRDVRSQAVLAIQGKPLNALRASVASIRGNPILLRVIETLLGVRVPADWTDQELVAQLSLSRGGVYDRVTLLMDPDADGIHCGVLMMGFLRRFFQSIVEEHRLFVVRAPMFVLRLSDGQMMGATMPEQVVALEKKLRLDGITDFQKQRFRGLASLPTELLRVTCVDPATRWETVVTRGDVEAAVAAFDVTSIRNGD